MSEFVCGACQKSYVWKPELAGKKVRCTCGTIIPVPRDATAAPVAAAPSLAASPAPATPAAPATRPAPIPAAAHVDRSSLEDAIRTRVGIIPGKTSETKERERLEAHRAQEEKRRAPKPSRDIVIPLILIVIGVALLFIEVTHFGKKPVDAAAAIPLVLMRCILAIGLLGLGMLAAKTMMDVDFAQSLTQSALRIIAIAVAPCALYNIGVGSMGDLAGPAVGSFASIIAYAILFKTLLLLDTRDTAVCVLTTWIMVAMANYAAFRAEAYLTDAWI